MEAKRRSRIRFVPTLFARAPGRNRAADGTIKPAGDQLRRSSRLQSARNLSALIGISASLIYLATLTSDYYWDGITFALQIEKVAKGDRGAELLFHQNHLLYNAVGYLLYKASRAAGFAIRALDLLQIVNALIGGLAVAVFFHIAERVTRRRYVSLVCTAALAIFAAWWKMTTDADAYILALLFMLIAAANLLGDGPRWTVAGAALAGAMLIHELAALFFPAAVLAVFSNGKPENRTRFAAKMSALAWTVPIFAYYLCSALFHGGVWPLEVLRWATSNPTGQHLASSPASGILVFPRTNIDAIVGHSFALFRRRSGWAEQTAALAASIAGLMFVLTVLRRVDLARALNTLRQWTLMTSAAQRKIAAVIIVWIATYAVFFLFWGPLIYYRIFYAPAIALGFGLLLSNYHGATGAKPSGGAALAVTALALFNLSFYIGPNMRSGANVIVAGAAQANGRWNEKTVIFFADRNEADTAFEYFNQSTRWKRLTRNSAPTLADEVARIRREGGEAWLNRGAIELIGDGGLRDYELRDEIAVDTPYAPARYVKVEPIN